MSFCSVIFDSISTWRSRTHRSKQQIATGRGGIVKQSVVEGFIGTRGVSRRYDSAITCQTNYFLFFFNCPHSTDRLHAIHSWGWHGSEPLFRPSLRCCFLVGDRSGSNLRACSFDDFETKIHLAFSRWTALQMVHQHLRCNLANLAARRPNRGDRWNRRAGNFLIVESKRGRSTDHFEDRRSTECYTISCAGMRCYKVRGVLARLASIFSAEDKHHRQWPDPDWQPNPGANPEQRQLVEGRPADQKIQSQIEPDFQRP
jgi:hypothetical protein